MNKDHNKEMTSSGVAYGAISFVIVGFLGCQLIAGFWPSWGFHAYTWPFLNYPMYSYASYEGDRIDARTLVFGRLEDGTEVEIVPEDLHTWYFKFDLNFAKQIRPGKEETLKPYVKLYEQIHGKRLTELRSANFPMVLGKEGAIPAPSETLFTVDVSDLYGEDS